jgi:hypothetical protein
MKNILNNCISFNIKVLKRRSVQYNVVPKEFAVVELRKNIKNAIDSFVTFEEKKKTVFRPELYDLKRNIKAVEPIIQEPPITVSPIEITLPIKEEPILIQPTPEPIVITEPIITPIVEPIVSIGGGGGGGSIYREYDTLDRQNLGDGGLGRERIEST